MSRFLHVGGKHYFTMVLLLFLFSKFCCHLQTLLRRSKQTNSCSHKKTILHCSLNLGLFCTKRWKSTNGGSDHGNVHRCTKLMLSSALCAMCSARFQPCVTCVFVSHHVIDSRLINLHKLLPWYTNNKTAYLSGVTMQSLLTVWQSKAWPSS